MFLPDQKKLTSELVKSKDDYIRTSQDEKSTNKVNCVPVERSGGRILVAEHGVDGGTVVCPVVGHLGLKPVDGPLPAI